MSFEALPNNSNYPDKDPKCKVDNIAFLNYMHESMLAASHPIIEDQAIEIASIVTIFEPNNAEIYELQSTILKMLAKDNNGTPHADAIRMMLTEIDEFYTNSQLVAEANHVGVEIPEQYSDNPLEYFAHCVSDRQDLDIK